MRHALALLAAALALLLPATASGARKPPRPLSSSLLLERLADPVKRLAPLPPGFRPLMVSSHDRTGGNVDGGSYGGPASVIGLPRTYVRQEEGGYVMYETHRPGCLVRTFLASAGPPVGTAAPWGRLQVFIDGALEPSFNELATDLYEGKLARYPRPLVGDYLTSSGGNFSYVPFCFSRSLKLRTTALPIDAIGWWQLNLLLAPHGTRVVPFDSAADLTPAAQALARAGNPPPRPPTFTVVRELAAGSGVRVRRLRRAGRVRYLRFAVSPFDIATLTALRLRVTVDRARSPQVDVPLASLFGDGIELRPIAAAAFGMDPVTGSGYFALPVPYRRGAVIELTAERAARVRLEGWIGRRRPQRGAGRLHGVHRVEQAGEGLDTRIIDAPGSGRLASMVMDVLDGGPASGANPLQRFLEGDERVHVDGARSPSMYGTGHEELSNAGFYFFYGPFSLELGGAGPLGSLPNGAGTQSQYRVFSDEGPRWWHSIAYGHEHGGGDEQPARVGVTTFSYRARKALRSSDRLVLGHPESERAHGFAGDVRRDSLSAYFEGERDGNSTVSTVVVGGSYYAAPPPESSPEAFASDGVVFTGPLSVRLRVGRRNRGLVLRGLFDQAGPLVPLEVIVGGRPAGLWEHPSGVATSWKRWLEDDFDVPRALTRGRRRVTVTLTPRPLGAAANLYGLEALTRPPPPSSRGRG